MTDKNRFRLHLLDEVHSTSSLLHQWCEEGEIPELTVIAADYQTAGRGQVGNTWEAERGKNLTFSLSLRPQRISIKNSFMISQLTSLAIKHALEVYCDDIRIKWPNDIYWRDKKICGMLIENDLMGLQIERSVVGIGININQAEFVSNAPNPVSLLQIVGHEVDRLSFLQQFMSNFQSTYEAVENGDISADQLGEEYKEALYRSEGFFAYEDAEGIFEACLNGVEPTGDLLLQDREGAGRRYWFKEVAFKI